MVQMPKKWYLLQKKSLIGYRQIIEFHTLIKVLAFNYNRIWICDSTGKIAFLNHVEELQLTLITLCLIL